MPLKATQNEPVFDPWERYLVPDFPLHVLPPAVQQYVTSQAVVIGCDPAALAMAALTAISGALDLRFAVKMMRNGNWWEHPRLWTLLVGDPSRKKTPILKGFGFGAGLSAIAASAAFVMVVRNDGDQQVLGEVVSACLSGLRRNGNSPSRANPLLVLRTLEGLLERKHESQGNRHSGTEQNCANFVPPAPNQRRQIFGLWNPKMSHGLFPFKDG